MTKPWTEERFGHTEIHCGSADIVVVNVSANQTVEIDKLYGSLCAFPVRVRLEYTADKSDWVVEYLRPDNERWVEKARWDCQENWGDDE